MRPLMRAWRAVLASFGASTSLVLAGAMGLAAVSTIVAFQGWPGVEPQNAAARGAVVAQARTASSRTVRESAVVVVPTARRVAPLRASAPRAQRTTVATTPVRTNVSVTPSQFRGGHTQGATSSISAAPGGEAEKAPTKQTSSSVGDPVRRVGEGLDGTVQQTTKSLGDGVRPVSPALSNTLDETGQALGETVKAVTDAVGAVLDGLKPKQ